MKAVRVSAADGLKASRPAHHRGHSHSGGLLQEHDHEPVPGLPQELPAGERILWQGAPRWQALVVDAFHFRKLTLYFGVILALRLFYLVEDGLEGLQLLKAMGPFFVLSISALLMVWSLAWLSARHTLYTITNRRVVMRIGIVLTVTFNLPYSRINAAHLRKTATGHGDVAIEISHANRIPWLQLWPHARAWHLKNPQPTLRGLADAEQAAGVLSQAWAEARGERAMPAQQTSHDALGAGLPVVAN